VKCWYLL